MLYISKFEILQTTWKKQNMLDLLMRNWKLRVWCSLFHFFSCDLQDFKFSYVNCKAFGASFLFWVDFTLVCMPNPKVKSWTESIKQVPELVYLHGRSQREIMTQEHRMQDDVQFNLCTDWNRSTARAVLQSYTELL